jgi:predicted nucleic acid-binding protein
MIAAVDTSVLIYAADRASDPRKHKFAAELLNNLATARRGLLPLQALTEFYAFAIRKSEVAPDEAAAFVDAYANILPVREANLADAIDAMRVHRDHAIQFWDGMIWSVARRFGARIVLSEDFQDGRVLEGVRFVNPFTAANAPILAEIVGR